MPTIKIDNFNINKSYIEPFSKSKKSCKTMARSRTQNDLQRKKKIKKNENEEFGLYDKSNKSSFHMFKIMKQIGNGAYGRVYLVI